MMSEKVPDKTEASNAGTRRKVANGYVVQFSIGGSKRKSALIPTAVCKTEVEVDGRQKAIAELVSKLRKAGYDSLVPNTIKKGAIATPEGLRTLQKFVARVVTGKEPGFSKGPIVQRNATTIEKLAELWTSGDLARQYPDHVKVKKTSNEDARMFEWFNRVRLSDGSTFGSRNVADVTLDDCDHVMTCLPETTKTSATRRHYAKALRKLLAYAVYPMRLRESLPIPTGWLPKNKNDKAKGWIYPSEDLALMACTDVALARRIFFGFLVREGVRVGEALSLTWADIDLERGVLRLDTNKTDDPRSWALGLDVTKALNAWKKIRGAKVKKVPHIFPQALLGDRGDYAHHLRESLKLAGVKRTELFDLKPGRLLLRTHDLRGSFVTLALASGQTEAWVTDRTGHRSSAMIYRYKRASRTAAELGLGWFAPLDKAIPELDLPIEKKSANEVQTNAPRRRDASLESKNSRTMCTSRHLKTAVLPLRSRRSEVRIFCGAPRFLVRTSPQASLAL